MYLCWELQLPHSPPWRDSGPQNRLPLTRVSRIPKPDPDNNHRKHRHGLRHKGCHCLDGAAMAAEGLRASPPGAKVPSRLKHLLPSRLLTLCENGGEGQIRYAQLSTLSSAAWPPCRGHSFSSSAFDKLFLVFPTSAQASSPSGAFSPQVRSKRSLFCKKLPGGHCFVSTYFYVGLLY